MTLANAKNSPALRRNRVKGAKLDALNEKLADHELTLHPTKGYRRMSHKRIVAAQLTYMIKTGAARGLSLIDKAVMLHNAR